MNTATQFIERRKDHKGRILFVVAGMVSTYDEAEAQALTDEAVEALLCPLTISAAATPNVFTLYQPVLQPLCNGLRPE